MFVGTFSIVWSIVGNWVVGIDQVILYLAADDKLKILDSSFVVLSKLLLCFAVEKVIVSPEGTERRFSVPFLRF